MSDIKREPLDLLALNDMPTPESKLSQYATYVKSRCLPATLLGERAKELAVTKVETSR